MQSNCIPEYRHHFFPEVARCLRFAFLSRSDIRATRYSLASTVVQTRHGIPTRNVTCLALLLCTTWPPAPWFRRQGEQKRSTCVAQLIPQLEGVVSDAPGFFAVRSLGYQRRSTRARTQ